MPQYPFYRCKGLFHPLDTTAKRLMNNKENVNFKNVKQVVLRDHHHKGWIRGLPSLYPGLGFATTYKITQRIYKYTGQNVLKNYLLNNHLKLTRSSYLWYHQPLQNLILGMIFQKYH